jgi:hypothetical protein
MPQAAAGCCCCCTRRQLNRCYDTPMALVITDKGLGRAVVAEAEEITQAAAT